MILYTSQLIVVVSHYLYTCGCDNGWFSIYSYILQFRRGISMGLNVEYVVIWWYWDVREHIAMPCLLNRSFPTSPLSTHSYAIQFLHAQYNSHHTLLLSYIWDIDLSPKTRFMDMYQLCRTVLVLVTPSQVYWLACCYLHTLFICRTTRNATDTLGCYNTVKTHYSLCSPYWAYVSCELSI